MRLASMVARLFINVAHYLSTYVTQSTYISINSVYSVRAYFHYAICTFEFR